MVGRQNDDGAAGDGRQLVHQHAQGRVEAQHLLAHLGPLGAVAVADAVGGRQADAQHVRNAATTQLLAVHQLDRPFDGQLVQDRRAVEAEVGRRHLGVEGLARNGPLPFQAAAGGVGIGPAGRLSRETVDHAGVQGRHRGQTRLGRLARLDIGGEAEVVGQPEGAVALVPSQGDGAAILARHAVDAAFRADRLQPVAQGRGAQLFRTDRAVVGVLAVGQGILRRGQAIGLLARRRVQPVVGGNAAAGRVGAGQDGRVAGAGHGHPVGLIAVDRDHALIGQGLQPAGELAAVLVEQIGAELIDHHGDDQGRGGAAVLGRRSRSLSRSLSRLGERRGRSRAQAEAQTQGGSEKSATKHETAHLAEQSVCDTYAPLMTRPRQLSWTPVQFRPVEPQRRI